MPLQERPQAAQRQVWLSLLEGSLLSSLSPGLPGGFLCTLQVSQYEKAKEQQDHYFNKRRNKPRFPGATAQALLSQHFWRSLKVSQVVQLILMFREAWETLYDRNPLLFL